MQYVRIIQTEVSKAGADNRDQGLYNSDILSKPNSVILLFILQENQPCEKMKTYKNLNINFSIFHWNYIEIHAKYRWKNTWEP